MSRTDLDPCATWFLWASASPLVTDDLAQRLLEGFEALGTPPSHVRVTTHDARIRRFAKTKFASVIADPDTSTACLEGRERDPVAEVALYIRTLPRYEDARTRRHAILYSGVTFSNQDPGVVALLRVLVDAYPVVHGGAARMATRWHASSEASLMGFGGVGISDEMERRLLFDGGKEREAMTLLRRLYPVTIIGPHIWAKLPPMPDVEPRPKVEDLGNCKMLTCWPELVDAHDLQFLLGTRELRRWLWPFTIQNPADDPDEVDRKLRWAELLPW